MLNLNTYKSILEDSLGKLLKAKYPEGQIHYSYKNTCARLAIAGISLSQVADVIETLRFHYEEVIPAIEAMIAYNSVIPTCIDTSNFPKKYSKDTPIQNFRAIITEHNRIFRLKGEIHENTCGR